MHFSNPLNTFMRKGNEFVFGSGSEALSGSIPLTNGSGSGRPKKIWIRFRIPNTANKETIWPLPVARLMLLVTVEFQMKLMFSAWRFFSSSIFIQKLTRFFQSSGNPCRNLNTTLSLQLQTHQRKYYIADFRKPLVPVPNWRKIGILVSCSFSGEHYLCMMKMGMLVSCSSSGDHYLCMMKMGMLVSCSSSGRKHSSPSRP